MNSPCRRLPIEGEALDSPPTVTDLTLAKWKAGDRNALLAAVRPWQNRVYRIAFRIVGTCHDAEEVWQTLMLRLLHGGVALPSACDFPAWLRRCAVNEAITFLRRRQRAIGQAGQSDISGEIPSSAPEPPEAIADAELRERLQDELSRLSAQQRAMLALRYDECLTVREIAAVLECPHSTIQYQLSRAIECLRRRFVVAKQERVSDG
jgi:RNA polymerase sigma-70 factor, ECF subfamily